MEFLALVGWFFREFYVSFSLLFLERLFQRALVDGELVNDFEDLNPIQGVKMTPRGAFTKSFRFNPVLGASVVYVS